MKSVVSVSGKVCQDLIAGVFLRIRQKQVDQLARHHAKHLSGRSLQHVSRDILKLNQFDPVHTGQSLKEEDCIRSPINSKHTFSLLKSQRQRIVRLSASSTKRSQLTKKTKVLGNSGIIRSHPSFKAVVLLPIQLQRNEQIQALRVRKQKIYDLQRFFMRQQQEEKKNVRVERHSTKPFTTDYNGELMQVKPVKVYKQTIKNMIASKVRDQRHENRMRQGQTTLKVMDQKYQSKNRQGEIISKNNQQLQIEPAGKKQEKLKISSLISQGFFNSGKDITSIHQSGNLIGQRKRPHKLDARTANHHQN